MNTLKRKLTAALLTLAMLLSLMPAMPQAAEAATSSEENDWLKVDYYTQVGDQDRSIDVIVQTSDGKQLTSLNISNYNWGVPSVDTITLKNTDYYIRDIQKNGSGVFAVTSVSETQAKYSWTTMDNGDQIIVTVDSVDCAINDLITGGVTRTYRIYEDQVMKMIYDRDKDIVNGNDLPNITSMKPVWKDSFRDTPGAGSNKTFLKADLTHSPNEKYWHLEVTCEDGKIVQVQPYQIESIQITYEYNGTEKTIDVPANDLVYYGHDVETYDIELNDSSFNMICFYSETDGLTGNIYQLYALRAVVTNTALDAENMPPIPTYGNGSKYVFTNWEVNAWDGSGTTFDANDVVTEDINVYAKKISTEGQGGIEIHVMNDNNALIERAVEIYNAENSANLSVDQIDMDSIKIRVNGNQGTSTNEYYWENEWKDKYGWYWVSNYNLSSLPDGSYHNDRVPFAQIDNITIYFQANDGTVAGASTIEVGDTQEGIDYGELEKMQLGDERIIELRLKGPAVPPTEEELEGNSDNPGILGEDAVTVQCTTNEEEHQAITTGLLPDSYSVSEKATWQKINGEAAYYVDVTVENDKYVKNYNSEHKGHTLDGADTQLITLKWDTNANAWTPITTLPVIFKVTCNSETPDPDEPKDLTGLTKEVITEEVEDIDGTYQYPTLDKEGNPILSVDTGTEVTLLYKITVTGDKNVGFTVKDDNTVLVKVEGASGEDLIVGTTEDSYTGTINADNGVAVLYVAKNFGTVDSDRDLENIAAVVNESGGTRPDPDDDDEVVIPVEVTYTLNYNANGGNYLGEFKDEKVATVSGLKNGEYAIWTKDDIGREVGEKPENEFLPVHDPVEENAVVFVGWSLTADKFIYDKGDMDVLEALRESGEMLYRVDDKVTIENADVTLYAVWGYDKDGGGTPDVFEDSYSLTYDANGGEGMVPVDKNAYTTDETVTLNTEDVPEHDAVNSQPVTFLGWSQTKTDKIYDAGENYGEVVTDSVTFAGKDITVYAVWGYDQNGDGIADAKQIVITPADIVAYTGGDGYTGVLNQKGEEIGTDTHGLPEPGFYFILPYELNAKLSADPEEMIDLSNSLRLSYSDKDGSDERSWTLKLYNTNAGVDPEDNVANEKYVYSMVAGETNPHPVRLEIRDEAGNLVTDDQFNITLASLYQTYDMKLYTDESVDRTAVKAEYSTDGGTTWQDAGVEGISRRTATLTIRGTNDEEPINSIETEVTEPVTEITAEDGNEVTYYVNGSSIPVVEQGAVQLLADSIVVDDDGETQETLENAIISSEDNTHGIDDSYTFDFSYLDLVDTSNGNAYATTGGDEVTIYWPYPEDMDQDDTFYVAHFDGLDRDFDGDVEAALADGSTELKLYSEGDDTYELETTENGIKFTTSTFSPFALVYDPDQNNGGNQGGWHPGGGSDGPDGLNTEDHFSYIVGYAEDYRTGEPTDNEDLWPVKPNNQITRAEVATIFYRLLEDEVRDEYDTTVNDFSDVSADSWYNQTVSTLASMGIVKGYEDGSFRPNAPITRAEFGAIATRFFAETGATYVPGTFTDVTGDEWYANAIQDAVNLGLIGGYEDGTVRPNNNITRAEACAIVNRTLGRVPDADHLLPDDVMKTWPDNPESAWFYADMQEATNGHEYEWIKEDGNKIENWTDIMLDNDWTDR